MTDIELDGHECAKCGHTWVKQLEHEEQPMKFHGASTNIEEYAENQRKLGKVEGQLEVLNPLMESKLRAASVNAERANEYREKPKHITKQYNLMAFLTGGRVMPDDTNPSTDTIKYYSGSVRTEQNGHTNKTAVEKSYKLMRMITGS